MRRIKQSRHTQTTKESSEDAKRIAMNNTSKFEQVFWRFAFGIITLASLFLLYTFYLLFYPFQVITYKDDVLPVEKHTLKPGDPIPLIINYCKVADYDANLNGQIESAKDVFPLPPTTKALPVGCHKVTYEGFYVPEYTIPGKYVLRYEVTYHINQLRTTTYHHMSQQFEVVN